MAEYPGAARAGVSPNRSDRQGKVKLFIVHHYAGTQDPESAWRRFNAPNDRSVSPNYQVNADGSVFEVVPPDRFRAWTTGAIDHQAVTCETQNTTGAPNWGISAESHEAIAHLIAWAAQRYGFPIQRGRVDDGNVVAIPGVVGHRETPAGRQTSTSCPGPSMNLDWLVERARQIANGEDMPLNQQDLISILTAEFNVPGVGVVRVMDALGAAYRGTADAVWAHPLEHTVAKGTDGKPIKAAAGDLLRFEPAEHANTRRAVALVATGDIDYDAIAKEIAERFPEIDVNALAIAAADEADRRAKARLDVEIDDTAPTAATP